MKREEAYITDCRNLLITTKIFKNGKIYADEISPNGSEDVELYEKESYKIGNGYVVYAVISKNRIVKNRTSFYFNKDFAKAVVNEMNRDITTKEKPYFYKKMYLINPTP